MPLGSLELSKYIEEQGINTLKLAVKNIIDVYRDKWEHVIRAEIRRQFTNKSLDKLRHLCTRELNILKKVVNETALVYKSPAERKAIVKTGEDDDGEVFEDDETYSKINQNRLNSFLKIVNKYTELCNQTLVQVCWREGKLDYDLINFDNAEIYTDPTDWKKVIAVKYYVNLELPEAGVKYAHGNPYTTNSLLTRDMDEVNGVDINHMTRKKFQTMFLWTLEDKDKDGNYKSSYFRKYKCTEDGEPIEIEKQENPYKDDRGNPVLPFVLFWRAYPVDRLLDFTTGNDLFDANINVALNMVHLNELLKYQSYKQVYMKVRSLEDVPKNMEMDAQTAFVIVDETQNGIAEIGTLDIQSNVNAVWEVIKQRIITILGTRGVSPSALQLSGSPASGIALKVDKMPLLEKRQDDVEIYREKEEELFKLMRIVNNRYNTEKISDKAEFQIDFGEINFPVDPMEKRNAEQIDITNNVITPIDIIRERNPDLTEEEAEAQWYKNKGINKSSASMFDAIQQPAIQAEEDEEEDETES